MAEHMKTWAGQFLIEGSIVGRGARDGNTSSFKVGVVERFYPEGDKVRVHWLFERGYQFAQVDANTRIREEVPWELDSHGTCDVNSLFVLPLATLSAQLKPRLTQMAIHYSVALAGDIPKGQQ